MVCLPEMLEATPGIEPGCTDLQSMRQVRITKGLAANQGAWRRQSINRLSAFCKP